MSCPYGSRNSIVIGILYFAARSTRRFRRPRGLGILAVLPLFLAISDCSASPSAPEVIIRGDGSYENAIAWQYEASAAPDYGAFAVRFPEALQSRISAVVLDLTAVPPTVIGTSRESPTVDVLSLLEDSGPLTELGFSDSSAADIYLWDESAGAPGAVLWIQVGSPLTLDVAWPDFARITVPVDPMLRCEQITGDAAWAGFWGDWPDAPAAAFVGTDQDGFGPAGVTRIAPDLGFPAGWQDVSVAWGGITALGIGVLAEPCGQEPVLLSTWGTIKRLYAW